MLFWLVAALALASARLAWERRELAVVKDTPFR